MKKILALSGVMASLALSANAAVLYDLNFDAVPAGVIADNTVIPAAQVGTVANPASDVLSAVAFSSDGPNFAAATDVAIPAFSATQAMLTESGGKSEGLLVQMGANYLGDLTVEVQMLQSGAVAGNTADLYQPFSDEWPFGQTMQIILRIHGPGAGDTGMNFHTDRGDSNNERVVEGSVFDYGAWKHIGATVDYDPVSPELTQIEMFIDGVSEGTSVYNASTASFILGASTSLASASATGSAFAVGLGLNQFAGAPGDNRGLDGAIDALVISDTVLGPGTFALATTPATAVPVELSVFGSE